MTPDKLRLDLIRDGHEAHLEIKLSKSGRLWLATATRQDNGKTIEGTGETCDAACRVLNLNIRRDIQNAKPHTNQTQPTDTAA